MLKGRRKSKGRADVGEAARSGKKQLIRVYVLISVQQNLAWGETNTNLVTINMFHICFAAPEVMLDVALGSLVWWLATLHIAGGLKLDGHCGPFQPRPFYDSMISLVNANLLSSDSPILLKFFQLLVLLEIPKLREKYV